MPPASSDDSGSAEGDLLVHAIGNLVIVVAAVFLIYGMHLAVTLLSMHVLLSRGIRNSRARMVLFIIAAVELLISTSYAVLVLVLNGFLWMAGEATDGWVDHWLFIIMQCGISNNFLVRFNLVFSDGIIVWRTWMLYPHSTCIKIVLVFCMVASSVSTFVDASLDAARALRNKDVTAIEEPGIHTMMTALPFLITNLICTSLIGYKTWCHRQDVKKNLAATGAPRTKANKILLLLVESGGIYCFIWVVYIIVELIPDPRMTILASLFTEIFPLLAALFPMLIILMAALEDPEKSTIGNSPDFNFNIPSSLSMSMRYAEATLHNRSILENVREDPSNRISAVPFPSDVEEGGLEFSLDQFHKKSISS